MSEPADDRHIEAAIRKHMSSPAGRTCLLCFGEEALRGGAFFPDDPSTWELVTEPFIVYTICVDCLTAHDAPFQVEKRLRAFRPSLVN